MSLYHFDKNFAKRQSVTNVYQNQLQTINDDTKKLYLEFLQSRINKVIFDKPTVQNFIQNINFKQPEKDFFKSIHDFVKPPMTGKESTEEQMKYSIGRGRQRAKQFKELIKNKKLGISLEGKIMADIGCGNGVISKEFAKIFHVKQCDMFDPYMTERQYDICFGEKDQRCKNIEFNFYQTAFDDRTSKIQYDIIMLSSSLHHILNPISIMNQIKESLVPGGYLFVREHLPIDNQGKMFLYLQEKTWALGLSNEEKYSAFEKKTHPPEAYFTEKELNDLIDMKFLGKMRENNYEVNGFANYIIYTTK